MRKRPNRKLIIALLMLTFTLLSMTSCVSTTKSEIILPNKPERSELPHAKDVKDLVYIISEYESLVEQWEAWAQTVEEIIQQK